jgi:Flp pilus assembly protein TadG
VKSNARGVAAIEFALILPVFLLLALGMIDYGWYFFIDLTATNASREAARIATTFPGACPNGDAVTMAQSTAKAKMTTIGQGANTTVTVTCNNSVAGDPEFQVDVEVNFPQLTGYTLIPLPRQGSTKTVQAKAQSSMRGVP